MNNHRAGTYNTISVCIEDGRAFDAITNGARWNGWQMPWFTLEQVRQIQGWVEDGVNANDIIIEGDAASVFYHSLDERITCETMQHEGITHYFIDGWCWQRAVA
tara:strand:+ start:1894 stop:2205 length:312 start_codon:yes stop_codon:yes gene_type:complete